MKLVLVQVVLVVTVICPVWLQVDTFHSNDVIKDGGDVSFLAQPHASPAGSQCIGNCTSQSDSFFTNNIRNPPMQQQMMEEKPTGFFSFIYSVITSLLNYFHRLFVNPWMGFVGLGQSSSTAQMDRNAYTVEGRSSLPIPSLTTPSASDWHEIGTTAFKVLSSIFLNDKPPSTTPSPSSTITVSPLSSSSVQSTPATISAINPL